MEVIIEVVVLLVIEITLNYGDLISLHNQRNSLEHKISCMRYNNHKPQSIMRTYKYKNNNVNVYC